MYTTEQIVFAITTSGVLRDAERAAQTFDFGGLKFIMRAALGLSLADSDWIRYGVIHDLASALGAKP